MKTQELAKKAADTIDMLMNKCDLGSAFLSAEDLKLLNETKILLGKQVKGSKDKLYSLRFSLENDCNGVEVEVSEEVWCSVSSDCLSEDREILARPSGAVDYHKEDSVIHLSKTLDDDSFKEIMSEL